MNGMQHSGSAVCRIYFRFYIWSHFILCACVRACVWIFWWGIM